jgi:hypothetical protein
MLINLIFTNEELRLRELEAYLLKISNPSLRNFFNFSYNDII